VLDCVVVMNVATGKSRGFGFVNFKDPSCVETVLAAGPHVLDGKQVWSLHSAAIETSVLAIPYTHVHSWQI